MAQDTIINIRAKVSGQQEIQGLQRQFKETQNTSNALKTSFGSLKGALASLGVALGAIEALKFTIVSTAELETQTRSLQVLTGSLDSAKTVIAELQAFGAVTPFTSSELIETAKRLKAFGVETEKLVDTTKRLGDVAGATGADLGGVATAFGQIVAKGRLQGEELLQLQERGINLQDELQKMYRLTGDQFRDALEKGRISADAVEIALKNLTDVGGKYADGAIAQSDTLAGLFSTLQDNVTRLAQTLGTVLAPALKAITNIAIEGLNTINKQFEAAKLAENLGIQGEALNRITQEANRQADELVELRFPGIGGGFEKSAERNKLFLERFNDLIRQYGYSAGLLQAEVAKIEEDAIELPELLGGTGGAKGGRARTRKSKEANKLTEEQYFLELKILEARREQNEYAQVLAELDLDIYKAGLKINEDVLQGQLDFLTAETTAKEKLLKIDEARVKDAEDLMKGIEAFNASLADMVPETENLKELWKSVGDTITSSVAGAIEDAIFGAKSLQESLSGLLKSLASIFIQFGTKSLLGGLFPSANGNVFAENKIVPFAYGGVVKKPTLFPMANGIGLMGEAGPEAIMPLRRTSSGRLGVEATGGTSNIVVNVDASGTRVQGDDTRGKQLGGAISAAVQAELIKQRRPGGLLAS